MRVQLEKVMEAGGIGLRNRIGSLFFFFYLTEGDLSTTQHGIRDRA